MNMPVPSLDSHLSTSAFASPLSSSMAFAPVTGTAAASDIQTIAHVGYFTSAQLQELYTRQRGNRMAESKWIANRNIATGLIQSVASRLGFPQRTIATAQTIYQRFHLFYPPTDFVLHEVALGSLFLAAKLNDTPKKVRDILLASYALRFPQLVKGVETADHDPIHSGTKRKAQGAPLATIGSVSEADVDANILEMDRKRIMALEKLLLESLCFNFNLKPQQTFKLVAKFGRMWRLSRDMVKTAWKLAADMHRTTAPLQYPPNVIAVASIYAAALLACPPPSQVDAHRSATDSKADRSYPLPPPSSSPPLVGLPSSTTSSLSTPLNKSTQTDLSSSPSPARLLIHKLSQSGQPHSLGSLSSDDIPSTSSTHPQLGEDLESATGTSIEDVEEAVHHLLDLYISCVGTLPPTLYSHSQVIAASSSTRSLSSSSSSPSSSSLSILQQQRTTPSPHSPAETHPDFLMTPSPASVSPLVDSSQSSPSSHSQSRRNKLYPYEFSPPPFGVIEWLNSFRFKQLSLSKSRKPISKNSETVPHPHPPATTISIRPSQSKPTTTSQQQQQHILTHFSTVLTEIKIFLRGIEYERQKLDDHFLDSFGLVLQVSDLVHGKQVWNKKIESDSNLETLNRVKRRKVVSILRTLFVEPVIQLTDDRMSSTSSLPQQQQQHQHQQHQQQQQQQQQLHQQQQTIGNHSRPALIDHATRYIF